MKKTIITALLSLTLATTQAKQTSLYFENDVFHGTDHGYTHGTELAYLDDFGNKYYVWQGMYTPPNKKLISPQPYERPYAGWLALGYSYNTMLKHQILLTSEYSLGVIGPSAQADETQIIIHEVLGNTKPAGWQYQLKDEPAMLARYQIRRSFELTSHNRLGAYIVPKSEVVLGTVMDYVGVGSDLVFGYNADPYMDNQINVKAMDWWSLYVFAGVSEKYVAWNTLIDGNIWHSRDDIYTDREPFVTDIQLGICFRLKAFAISYTDLYRSKEYEWQSKAARSGALLVSVKF